MARGVINLLRQVRAVYDTHGVTEAGFAIDRRGRRCGVNSKRARYLCMIAAVWRVTGTDDVGYDDVIAAIHAELPARCRDDRYPAAAVMTYNDSGIGIETVRALLDRAIAAQGQ